MKRARTVSRPGFETQIIESMQLHGSVCALGETAQ